VPLLPHFHPPVCRSPFTVLSMCRAAIVPRLGPLDLLKYLVKTLQKYAAEAAADVVREEWRWLLGT